MDIATEALGSGYRELEGVRYHDQRPDGVRRRGGLGGGKRFFHGVGSMINPGTITVSAFLGFVGLGAASIGGVIGSYGARATAPEWFELESLRAEGEVIYQRRTVRIPALHASYIAKVVDSRGVSVCSGSGQWVYKDSPDEKAMTLDVWTNDHGCWERMEAGQEYVGIAEWSWTGSDGLPRVETGEVAISR